MEEEGKNEGSKDSKKKQTKAVLRWLHFLLVISLRGLASVPGCSPLPKARVIYYIKKKIKLGL